MTAKILVVDDEAAVRELLAEFLCEDYAVTTAANGSEAMALPPDYALMITDYVMPGINGIELGQQMQLRQPGLRVILISGSGFAEPPTDLFPFLAKPFRLNVLMQLIQQALDVAE